MGDVAWVTLTLWPWQDAWLNEDPELYLEFRSHGLADRHSGSPMLEGAMNGDRADYPETAEAPARVVIAGEMSGGSYELREDSNLLELLQDRGIAFCLVGDAKYEWDGDEIWWHPGMEKPFQATANESGRVLTERDYREMLTLSWPPAERIPEAQRRLAEARARRSSLPPDEPYNAARQTWAAAVERWKRTLHDLRAGQPPAVPLPEQLAAFFDPKPFDWRPPADYSPSLKVEVNEPA